MKHQLVEKLRIAVSERISKECQVVYILAESRKLLEKFPPATIPFALRMYCHWALHIDLTAPNTTERFLQRVDSFVESVLAGSSDIVEERRMFHEFAFWDTFRKQFREFLMSYSLPVTLCEDDSHWRDFLHHYARVIEDGSLCCQSKAQRLKYVDKVIIRRRARKPTNDAVPFDLAWHIVLSDGRALTIDVDTADLPDGSLMLIHGIKLHSEGSGGFFGKRIKDAAPPQSCDEEAKK